MRKLLVLLFLLVCCLGLFGGYLYLTEKIIAGNVKIAEGKTQIEQGEQMLTNGKTKLANGKRELTKVKRFNSFFNAIPLMNIAQNIPLGGTVLNIANNKIAEGSAQLSAGEDKIKSGEKQLAEGKLELQHGMERLYQANMIRVCLGMGAMLFGIIFAVLVFYWRKTLLKMLKR